MYTQRIIPTIVKPESYSPTANPIGLLSSHKIVQEQPALFAFTLAHEIRNPLSTINLALEMLQSVIKDDDLKIYFDIIMRGSIRINNILTNLLTSYQTDEAELEKHSIHELLDEVLAINNDRILLKNILVKKEYTTFDCKILVNKEKMKIALTNIIINAIEAMPLEQGQLTLVTKSINLRCIIEIRDNGIGISKENLKAIFKPFFTNKPGGLGLGLSATLDILHASCAKVTVQSKEGSGTLFTLSFNKIQSPRKVLRKQSV